MTLPAPAPIRITRRALARLRRRRLARATSQGENFSSAPYLPAAKTAPISRTRRKKAMAGPRGIDIRREDLTRTSPSRRRARQGNPGPRGRAAARLSAAGKRSPSEPALLSGRYRILGRVGEGGMGIVYKAQDTVLNVTVAIKFLPDRLMCDPVAAERFRQEAVTAMHLSHENIVKLHNLEVDRNRMFMVMEFVEGRDFRRILNELGALDTVSVLQIARSCTLALNYAHQHDVLHLDLKPENLMLTNTSVVKIVDFGTARRRDSERSSDGCDPALLPSWREAESVGGGIC